ncbi:sigma-70 family RNA polymerase sigma factor [Streptomyces sp. RFCAC02]|uniref:sigma-70 family RNA polymerase sigma factor n=1 Tax=Streptomyces sp. RFCAC02 TaxID=2499143 RepID=UPI0010217FDC|nr:sigma-70 family RNA polymerase sigma factor [Streptomyces sp. RFCAC02]
MGVEGKGGGSTVPRQRREHEAAGPGDLALVERMRSGDMGAYDELYRRHAASVRRYARTCCRDADTADDLTNEVFTATLQAVRGGAGPRASVRAYLLASVRRVAADWARTARREQLVEDFAVFAVEAEAGRAVGGAATAGADVRAMREADASMAVRAFRSLPERWQTVLWHTAVEEASPRDVAPLLGLTPNATAVLAHRAREGLRQAFLQEHVGRSARAGGECARYAARLGAYARGGLRARAERGLRRHLEECVDCATAAREVRLLNAELGALLPVAFIGWFAAGSQAGAAAWLGAAGGGTAAAAGSAAAAAGGGSGGGGAGALQGIGGAMKAGIASGVVATALAAALAFALAGQRGPDEAARPESLPSAPALPDRPEPADPAPPDRPAEEPGPSRTREPAEETAAPEPTEPPEHTPDAPPAPRPDEETTQPAAPDPSPSPTPPPPAPGPTPYELRALAYDLTGDGDAPTVRVAGSTPVWRRSDGLSIGGTAYAHGVSVGAASSVTIDLNRPCAVFRAVAGLDDRTVGLGAAEFAVYGDGVELWRSPVLAAGAPGAPVEVPLDGVAEMRLTVRPHGLLGLLAPAAWAESVIECG